MKTAILSLFAFLVLSPNTFAQQAELPLVHPDHVLLQAYPGEANVQLVEFVGLPESVKETFNSVDFGVEMGDGYYDIISNAYYRVLDTNGETVGYLEAALMSYTEDPDITLVGAMVNPSGRRIDDRPNVINSYNDINDENIKSLPVELQPSDEE